MTSFERKNRELAKRII